MLSTSTLCFLLCLALSRSCLIKPYRPCKSVTCPSCVVQGDRSSQSCPRVREGEVKTWNKDQILYLIMALALFVYITEFVKECTEPPQLEVLASVSTKSDAQSERIQINSQRHIPDRLTLWDIDEES